MTKNEMVVELQKIIGSTDLTRTAEETLISQSSKKTRILKALERDKEVVARRKSEQALMKEYNKKVKALKGSKIPEAPESSYIAYTETEISENYQKDFFNKTKVYRP